MAGGGILPVGASITAGGATQTGDFTNALVLPYYEELEALAEVDDDNLKAAISAVKETIASLKDLSVSVYAMTFETAKFNDTYSSTFNATLTGIITAMFAESFTMADYIKDTEGNLQFIPSDHAEKYDDTNVAVDTIATDYHTEYTADKDAIETAPADMIDQFAREGDFDLKLDPDEHYEAFSPRTTSFAITLDTALFDDDYTHTLDQLIRTYVQEDGSGLSATVEAAIYARARARIILESGRIARRITTEIATRLPYSGMLADLLMEADEDAVNALADVNNKILEEQGRLAYQSAIDRINQAIAFEKDLMSNFHMTQDRLLKAYVSYDDMQLKKDSNEIENFQQTKERKLKAFIAYDDTVMKKDSNDLTIHENAKQRMIKAYVSYDELGMKFDELKDAIHENNINRKLKAAISVDELKLKMESLKIDNHERHGDRKLKAYLAFDDIQLKQYSASIDYANLIYQNRRDAINSAVNIEQMLQQHYHQSEDRTLKADSIYDEMKAKNHWQYFETVIKQYIEYIGQVTEFIKAQAFSPEQLSFQNWATLSKILADGQLQISGLIANLTPTA